MDYIAEFDFAALSFIKFATFIALTLYIIFAIVVIKQVNLMNKTLDVGFEAGLRFIAWAHLLFAIGTFVMAVLIL